MEESELVRKFRKRAFDAGVEEHPIVAQALLLLDRGVVNHSLMELAENTAIKSSLENRYGSKRSLKRPKQTSFVEGELFRGHSDDGREIRTRTHSLSGHTLIGGTSGSGKTVCTKNLIGELHEQGIPTRILDTQKREYNLPGVRQVQIERRYQNIFVPPEQVRSEDWDFETARIFCNSYDLMTASLTELIKLLQEARQAHFKWNGGRTDPTFVEIFERAQKAVRSATRVSGDPLRRIIARMKPIVDQFGAYLDVETGTENEYLECSVTFYSGLPVESLKFFFVMELKRAFRRKVEQRESDRTVVVTVVDEAWRVFSNSAYGTEGLLQEDLRLNRGMAEYFVLVDQAPHLLPPVVKANVANKILFRMSDSHGVNYVRDSTGIDWLQARESLVLETGTAIAKLGSEEAFILIAPPPLN